MSEKTADLWREIVREAIGDDPTEPTKGTYFREAVGFAASKRSLEFPPSEEPHLRLIQLLERYPDVVSILRRPGQDFLVVPAGRSDLLAKGIQQRLYGIRRDLFEAFTMVSENHPYYDKSADRVIWQKPVEGNVLTDSLVPIEPATEGTEIQLRRDFTETVTEPSRSLLLNSLTSPQPLHSFSNRVRETALQRKWHSFRTERLLEKIQRWARVTEVEWKGAWLTDKPDYTKKVQVPSRETSIRTDHDPWQLLFSALDPDDIRRISIPLDLVLKAISLTKKR